jgi:hypothetical protein
MTAIADDDGTGTGLSSSMSGSKMPPPHVMASYNWDHQDVILRVVGSLQSRGYLVWVDTEQMKGATVDTMALAVEGSAVVLVGVSRAYKESSNCRMEAQYALQKKKPLVPLMLVEGYEADGWLGLLLGTSMWYALYGATLSSESAFEDRMDALCREIGSRGRTDAPVDAGDVNSAPGRSVMSLRADLTARKMRELLEQARASNITEADILTAQDAASPKAALVELILEACRRATEAESAEGDPEARAELEGLRMTELLARAQGLQLEEQALDAQDADNPKAAVIELLLRATSS